ncbi:hypothetical protein [Pseudonocardia sp. NPDC049635]|uniref:hypothetical protein n=1 Tax=Pseudonocardia sp. NPDC049635 TaxID=3155506 RepID=UPI0033E6BECA
MSSDGPDPPPTSGPAGGGPGRGRSLAVQVGEQLRELEQKVDRTAGYVADLAGHVSELAPRLDDHEAAITSLVGAVEASGAGGSGQEQTSLTPALGWSRLDPRARHLAWDALGTFVAQVLCSEYRLSRVELPDCWPVHPRAVRELAWLRSLHADLAEPGARADLVAEWHVRWLPAAITNLAAAIDPRECAPGRHRVTEEERRLYHERLAETERRGAPAPELSGERGPDRPRYLPDRFPPRRSYHDATLTAAVLPLSLDQATPAPPSSRDCWWDYFCEARHADTEPTTEPTAGPAGPGADQGR